MTLHLHYEKVDYEGRELIGRCQVCGLTKKYDPDGIEKPVIIEEGNMSDNQKPENWDKMSRRERGKFFTAHKAEIIGDIEALGYTRTRTKWGMASSTLITLKRRWNIPDDPDAPPVQTPGAPVRPSNGLPPLPAWKDDWPEAVQLRWLEVWTTLRQEK